MNYSYRARHVMACSLCFPICCDYSFFLHSVRRHAVRSRDTREYCMETSITFQVIPPRVKECLIDDRCLMRVYYKAGLYQTFQADGMGKREYGSMEILYCEYKTFTEYHYLAFSFYLVFFFLPSSSFSSSPLPLSPPLPPFFFPFVFPPPPPPPLSL